MINLKTFSARHYILYIYGLNRLRRPRRRRHPSRLIGKQRMLSRSLRLVFQRSSSSRPLSLSFGVRLFSNDVSPGSRAPLPSSTASALASGLPHDMRLLLLNAGLRHVKSHGWSSDALAAGADELGYVAFSSLLYEILCLTRRSSLILSQPPCVVHRNFLSGSRGIGLAHYEPRD